MRSIPIGGCISFLFRYKKLVRGSAKTCTFVQTNLPWHFTGLLSTLEKLYLQQLKVEFRLNDFINNYLEYITMPNMDWSKFGFLIFSFSITNISDKSPAFYSLLSFVNVIFQIRKEYRRGVASPYQYTRSVEKFNIPSAADKLRKCEEVTRCSQSTTLRKYI